MFIEARNPILYTENLSIGYGRKSIFERLNLHAYSGEQIALIGANGIGKSTLLRTIAGLQKPLNGLVLLENSPLEQYKIKERAKKISYVAAAPVYNRYMSVEELVRLGRFPYGNFTGSVSKHDIEIIEKALALTRLEHLRQAKINEISDGELRKALIARALAQDTPVIILDEPVSFLDPENRIAVLNILKQLADKSDKTLIFSSHDIASTLRSADKIWLLKKDELIQAAPEDLISIDAFNKVFNHTVQERGINHPVLRTPPQGRGIDLPDIRFDNELLSFKKHKTFVREIYFQVEAKTALRVVAFKHLTARLQIKAIECLHNQQPEVIIKDDSIWVNPTYGNPLVCNSFEELAKYLKSAKTKTAN